MMLRYKRRLRNTHRRFNVFSSEGMALQSKAMTSNAGEVGTKQSKLGLEVDVPEGYAQKLATSGTDLHEGFHYPFNSSGFSEIDGKATLENPGQGQNFFLKIPRGLQSSTSLATYMREGHFGFVEHIPDEG